MRRRFPGQIRRHQRIRQDRRIRARHTRRHRNIDGQRFQFLLRISFHKTYSTRRHGVHREESMQINSFSVFSVTPCFKSSSCTSIKLRHHKLTMPQRLGTGQPAVRRSHNVVDQLIAGLIAASFRRAQNRRHVVIDMLFHRGNRLRVSPEILITELNRIANDIALPGREKG